MQVKVLSVKNTFAYLIIYGGKDIENRTWNTDYRGRLYIHVSGDSEPATCIEDYPDLKSDERNSEYLTKVRSLHKRIKDYYISKNIPYGTDYEKADDLIWNNPDIWFVKSQRIIGYVDIVDVVKDSQSPWAIDGQYHWILKNPTPLKEPICSVKGRLGLWNYNLPE